MTVRAKMVVSQVTHYKWGGAEITFSCEYDKSIPEDRRFCEATPTGEAKMQVNVPGVVDQFPPGQTFYLDFTPVPKG